MHIFLDGRMVKWTGIGTYITNLLKRLPEVDSTYRFSVIVNPGEEHLLPDGVCPSILKAPIPAYSLKEQTLLTSSFHQADLAHFPHFSAPLLFNRPYVVTIHDLVYFLFRSACPHRVGHWYARFMYPRIARRARVVITDSDFSKREIVTRLSLPADLVKVIHLGVDTSRFRPQSAEAIAAVTQRYGISRGYLLYMGNHQPRKNIPRLIEAFARLGRRRDYQLVIGGPRDARRSEIEDALRAPGLEGQVILTGRVPSEDLPALYAGASCFVFPSLYEGFGLPLLEAMACGTPVVASNTSSLPEVVGDAGVLVDPRDVRSLAEGLERVLASQTLRDELREMGLRRARQFSWETTAKATVQAYQEALL